MRQDQLEQARQVRWRQDGNALLTLDDAERWLADTPLCLYLPRRQHLPVPAPSFVEAIAGRADATPNPEQIAAAAQMLARLVASGAVIALNLFGAAPGIGVSSFVGEHPDFLATPEALPYLYALQPERNPKREPSTAGNGRVSPLAAEAWKLLEREGALTTSELRLQLGREVTEAAVLRSLAELWHTMRVVPIPAENGEEGAHWELLSARHRRELTIGSTQSQTTALSILVSFYLQSAVAATAEEAEIFLSPVASRSRLRDVIHGLSTTRQLASFSLAGDEQFYVEGSLPEIAEEEETVVLAAGAIAGEDAGLEQNEPDLTEAAAANPQERPAAPRRSPRPAFGERARGSFAARDRGTPSSDRRGPSHDRRTSSTGRPPRREGGFRRPQRSGTGSSERGSFRRSEGSPEGAEGTSRPPRPNFERRARPSFGASADRRERPARPGGPARTGSSDRPDRGGAFRAGRPGGSFGKGRPPRPGGSSFRPGKSFPGKPFGDRPPRSGEGTERPRFRPAAGSGSPRFGQGRTSRPPRDGERPQRSFSGGEGAGTRPDRPFRRPQGDRPADGPRRFDGRSGAGARPGESARPARSGGFSRPPRRDGESRPPFGRGESRPPFRGGQSRPQGDRPFKRPYAPAGDRPPRRESAGGYVKPGYGKSGGGGDRPQRKFTPRPRPESRPEDRPEGSSAAGRPEGGERESRPFRPAGQRPSRPGGFGKPPARSGGSFRKPSFGRPSFARPSSGKPSFGKSGGYRKPTGDRPAPGGDRPAPGGDHPARPRSARPAFASGERPPRPAAGRDAASGPRKPGGFRKPGGPGKSFGKPRPAGAGSRGPRPAGARPAGAGKGRTSTTTSSGKPRRPGGFDKPGASGKSGTSSRPPAKGSFGDFKPRGKPSGAKRPGAKRPATKRPGGLGAPKRKPRSEGDEG
jgi:23S rRNA pseudouridine2605 synthase